MKIDPSLGLEQVAGKIKASLCSINIVFVADIDLGEEERDITWISALTRNPIANLASAQEGAQS